MKQIPLTRGLFALVDDEDFDHLNQWKWFAHSTDNVTFYAKRNTKGSKVRRVLNMHREILKAPQGIEVDHWNRNGLDNQRSNLRLATHGQNQANSSIRKDCASGVTGVHWNLKVKRWYVRTQGRYLGTFQTFEAARIARRLSEIAVFGEFAPS